MSIRKEVAESAELLLEFWNACTLSVKVDVLGIYNGKREVCTTQDGWELLGIRSVKLAVNFSGVEYMSSAVMALDRL